MRALAVVFLLLAQGAPSEEYAARLAKIHKSAAEKHFSVGDYLSTALMHRLAREQFYKAIELDPDHPGARRKLGFKKGESGWETDPAAKMELANKKQGADAEKIQKAVNEKLEQAGRDLAKQYVDLGAWCKKNQLEKESTDAYKKALEYDPLLATARKELGFEKDAKGNWLSKVEKELRREMKDGLPKAPAGAPFAGEGQTRTEEGLGQSHKKQESAHFLFEAPHLTEKQLGVLVQHAEHAYAMFHKIFQQTELFGSQKMNFVILKDKASHERYVETFDKRDKAHRDLAKKSKGTGGFPIAEWWEEKFPDPGLEDMTVHRTAQTLSDMLVGGKHHWIFEGVAYSFTRLIKETAATYCVDLAGTTPGSGGKNYQDPNNWPLVCKVWIRDGKDPDINAVVKCVNIAELDGAETVKAWSLLDFLLAEHRERFIEVCKLLRGGAEIEEALKTVFTWTIADLDTRWKAYVKATY